MPFRNVEPRKRQGFRAVALLVCLAVACAPAEKARPAAPRAAAVTAPSAAARAAPVWVVTTQAAPFARSSPVPSAAGASELVVDPSKTFQAVAAFGGAFNEQGWDALAALPEAEREAVLRALFDAKTGLGFNFCRTPIGASDYAESRYTLDETPGDFGMEHFSIERDRQKLIPYIQAALKVRPDLKLWGSAWTPPSWMKTPPGFDSGAMNDDPKVYAAYALYLAKFVESYRAAGIDVAMVVPQNEPAQLTHYPSCDWKPAQYVTFIRDHLGPLFKERGLTTSIFLGTINRDDWDPLAVLRDAGTARFVAGAAFQWKGIAHVAPVHAAFPELPIMQSETECGNNHWQPGFNPETPPNDFAYAAHTWRKFRDFIAAGASSYMLWNMVLDEHGKNIDALRPWPQNSAVVVDRQTKRVTYTPMYWVTKHFSGLIAPGARRVEASGAYEDRIAFVNPDGTLIVELMNGSAAPVRLAIVARGERHAVELPPRSFGSLVLPAMPPSPRARSSR